MNFFLLFVSGLLNAPPLLWPLLLLVKIGKPNSLYEIDCWLDFSFSASSSELDSDNCWPKPNSSSIRFGKPPLLKDFDGWVKVFSFLKVDIEDILSLDGYVDLFLSFVFDSPLLNWFVFF